MINILFISMIFTLISCANTQKRGLASNDTLLDKIVARDSIPLKKGLYEKQSLQETSPAEYCSKNIAAQFFQDYDGEEVLSFSSGRITSPGRMIGMFTVPIKAFEKGGSQQSFRGMLLFEKVTNEIKVVENSKKSLVIKSVISIKNVFKKVKGKVNETLSLSQDGSSLKVTHIRVPTGSATDVIQPKNKTCIYHLD